jgi:hypothetical protein
MDAGASAQTVSKNSGFTPLHLAAREGEVPACTTLAVGSNTSCDQSHSMLTNVSPVVLSGRLKVLEVLFAKCANLDVNAQDKSRRTPLHFAAARGDSRLCRLLVQHGASTELRNKKGRTCVDVALSAGHSQLAALLSSKDSSVCLPLLWVAAGCLHSVQQVFANASPTGRSGSIRAPTQSPPTRPTPPASGPNSPTARLQTDHYDATRRIVYLSKQLQASKRELNAVVEGNTLTNRFNQLAPVGSGNASRQSRLAVNASKQRYRDIVAYDSSRVQLAAGAGTLGVGSSHAITRASKDVC